MATPFNKGQMGRNIVFNRKSSIAQPSIAQCRNEEQKFVIAPQIMKKIIFASFSLVCCGPKS